MVIVILSPVFRGIIKIKCLAIAVRRQVGCTERQNPVVQPVSQNAISHQAQIFQTLRERGNMTRIVITANNNLASVH